MATAQVHEYFETYIPQFCHPPSKVKFFFDVYDVEEPRAFMTYPARQCLAKTMQAMVCELFTNVDHLPVQALRNSRQVH